MRTFYIELRNGLNPKDWIDLGTPMGIRFHPTSELQDGPQLHTTSIIGLPWTEI